MNYVTITDVMYLEGTAATAAGARDREEEEEVEPLAGKLANPPPDDDEDDDDEDEDEEEDGLDCVLVREAGARKRVGVAPAGIWTLFLED